MSGPLVVVVICYCFGVILAASRGLNFWLIWAAAVLILFFGWRFSEKNRFFTVLILLLALASGALSLENANLLPSCHISKLARYSGNRLYFLDGIVDTPPIVTGQRTSFTFRLKSIQEGQWKQRCCGNILVRMELPCVINYGDRLVLAGFLRGLPNYSSGKRSPREYLFNQGIYASVRIENSLQIIAQQSRQGDGLIFRIIGFSFWLRAKSEEVIYHNLPDLPGRVLAAMVLGQRRGIPWLVNNAMVKSGTVHILVVSGFNVGIVAFVVNLLLKFMRIGRKTRIALAIITLIFYCLATGASNPVLRATIMGIVFLSAYLFKRKPNTYHSLAIAALCILIPNPRQLFDIGLQLSFASVWSIAYFYPRLRSFLRIEDCKIRIIRFFAEGCLVSSSAWVATLGIIAYNFRILAPVTVLANLFIVPLATVITLCGFALVLCGSICYPLGQLIGATTSMLITLLLHLNAALIRIPFAYFYL